MLIFIKYNLYNLVNKKMITLLHKIQILKQKRTLLTVLCITLLSITLKEKNLSVNFLRFLMDDEKYYDMCNHTESSLPEKYTRYYDSPIPIVVPDEYQKVIIKLINDTAFTDFSYYAEYLPRIKFFLISLLFIFVFICFWVIFSFWRYCPAKCFKTKAPKIMYHKKTYLALTIITVLLILFISIISIILLSPLIQHLNGTGCSVFKVIRHVIYGTNEDYPDNGYRGIDKIRTQIELIIKIRTSFKNYEKYLKSGVNTCDKHRDNSLYTIPCKIIDLSNEASSLATVNLDEEYEYLQSFVDLCYEIENEYLDYVYLYIHDYIDYYIDLFGTIIFSLTLGLSCLSIIFILFYRFVPNFKKFAKVIYDIIWNMSIFISILTLILSVAFAAVGAVGNDFAIIAQYFVSEKNLKAGNESIIINCDEYKGACVCLNRCLNGNGRIAIPSDIPTDTLDQKKTDIENAILNIGEEIEKIFDFGLGSSKIKDALLNITNTALETFNLLTDLVDADQDICLFVKSDFEILVEEVDSIGTKAFAISFTAYFVFSLLALSTLFGILAAFDYKKLTNEKEISDGTKNVDLNIEMCINDSNVSSEGESQNDT